MKQIKITDIIDSKSAISPRKAQLVLVYIDKLLTSENQIEVSFSGVEDCTSSFTNTLFGQLYLKHGFNFLSKKLKVVDVPFKIWEDKIDNSIKLGTDENLRKLHQNNLLDIVTS